MTDEQMAAVKAELQQAKEIAVAPITAQEAPDLLRELQQHKLALARVCGLGLDVLADLADRNRALDDVEASILAGQRTALPHLADARRRRGKA